MSRARHTPMHPVAFPQIPMALPRRMPMALLLLTFLPTTANAQDKVSLTVHNLSVSGPGEVRAKTETQVCIFCHAPHNTGGMRPLWNRQEPGANYRIYRSSTLDANLGQPTGNSKMCLSCHDGTIALGSVLSRSDRIAMRGGDFMPAGLTNLGTDLSDDHPVSFFYTSGLAIQDGQLVDPNTLRDEIKLDAQGQLQCTSCHDAHHNRFGKFLVVPREFGELCTACHDMRGWSVCSHQSSSQSVSGAQGVDFPFGTVAENACRSCHRSHTAGGHERLLLMENEEDNCLDCHNGLVARTDILRQLDKFSAHDPRQTLAVHDPAEDPLVDREHVECTDCHNPHAVQRQDPPQGYIPIGATLLGQPGIGIGGAPVEPASYEYEICFRCHGDTAVDIPGRVLRQSQTINLRLRLQSTNPSFHPVVGPVGSSESPSLIPELPPGSMIRCTDCHSNDEGPGAGGSGPMGPHGSQFEFLLERNYTVIDDTVESEYAYALCYKCHQRTSILGNESFPEHSEHIVEERAPCSACHDPHGINTTLQGDTGDHTRLINFDTSIVFADPHSGRLEFRDTGRYRGSCTLMCHGKRHMNKRYGGM